MVRKMCEGRGRGIPAGSWSEEEEEQCGGATGAVGRFDMHAVDQLGRPRNGPARGATLTRFTLRGKRSLCGVHLSAPPQRRCGAASPRSLNGALAA